MELTAAAAGITSVFAGFDFQILSLFHQLELMAGSILTPLAEIITLVGEKGAIFLLAGIICLFFKKTRRMGFGIILAIAICFVINNLFIKDLVCRPRPFEYSDTFNSWWIAAGAYPEDSYSFPSGHVAAAAAAMMVYMMHRRHFLNFLFAALVVLLMGSSRMYLMGHYPSDVLGGIIVGIVAGLLGYGIVQLIWNAIWKKRGGAQALQNAGYQPNRGTQFNIPMGAPKPARAAGTSPFDAEALNDPMNFTAGGAIATNSNTMSFKAVPDQGQYPGGYQPAQGQYPGGYQADQSKYPGGYQAASQASASQSYPSAAQTAAFQAYYGNTEYAHSGLTAELNTASTTEFSAYLHPENQASVRPQHQANMQSQHQVKAPQVAPAAQTSVMPQTPPPVMSSGASGVNPVVPPMTPEGNSPANPVVSPVINPAAIPDQAQSAQAYSRDNYKARKFKDK
ncbi:MAG: phosphatase PAP2 family protein [Anaerotardibacter sp.]